MISLVQRAAIALAALVLTACASIPSQPPAGLVKSAQSVGVLSVAGDEAWFGYYGITVFENAERSERIADTQFDQQVEAQAVKLLTGSGVKRAEPLKVDRAAVAALHRGNRLRSYGSDALENAEFAGAVLKAAREQNLQYLMLLVPRFQAPGNHRSETAIGISVKGVGNPFRPHPVDVSVVMAGEWLLIDVAQGQPVSSSRVWRDPSMNTWTGTPPAVRLAPEQWERGFANFSPEQMAIVRKAIGELVTPTVNNLHRFIDPPALPASGPAPASR